MKYMEEAGKTKNELQLKAIFESTDYVHTSRTAEETKAAEFLHAQC